MARNVEIKARLRDRAAVEEKTRALATSPAEDLHQEDTFFHVANGRLKLRIINGTRGELIQYDREDAAGPKLSNYTVVPSEHAELLRSALERACGVRTVVRKRRRLYWIGNTRVHLDQVDGLGDFLELEVVLNSSETTADGEAIARDLIRKLGIEEQDLVTCAYVDLLKL
jgi:predicted adenylyl cyclase CyaB